MLILNFSHPITSDQQAQIEALAGMPVAEIRDIPVQFDLNIPFIPQVKDLLAQPALREVDWQGALLLINLPSFSVIAGALLAELHGRMGHFPAVLLLRPAQGTVICYEVAEIVNLQAMRDGARAGR